MANTNPSPDLHNQETIFQRTFSLDEQNHSAITTLRIAERLPIIFDGLVSAADDGEAYETLVRMIHGFHGSLEDLSTMAANALASILPVVSGLPAMQKDEYLLYEELSPDQQAQTYAMFSGHKLGMYRYMTHDGKVLCRKPIQDFD
jgi:hypothetical protein